MEQKRRQKSVHLCSIALAHIYFSWLVLPGVQSFNRTEHSSRTKREVFAWEVEIVSFFACDSIPFTMDLRDSTAVYHLQTK